MKQNRSAAIVLVFFAAGSLIGTGVGTPRPAPSPVRASAEAPALHVPVYVPPPRVAPVSPRPSPTAASRSRTHLPVKASPRPKPRVRRSHTPVSISGRSVSSTAYCDTGIMANGRNTHQGVAAGNYWPLGTRLYVSDSPVGPGIFTVEDRIGHGSELDFWTSTCNAARSWGRRQVTVRVA